jgi:HK97 family phage major capsid protein
MYQFDKASLQAKSATELFKLRTEKAAELNEMFTNAKTADCQYDLKSAQLDEVRERNAELSLIGETFEQKSSVETMARNAEALAKGQQAYNGHTPVPTMGAKDADKPRIKNLGEAFIKSEAGTNKKTEREVSDFDVKTLFQTTAGWAPETTHSGAVIMSAQRTPTLLDLMPSQQWSQVAYKYWEETTLTNNAAETAEAAAYPEAALAMTERTSPVQKIAVWLPVTDEQLDDVVGSGTYVQNRLDLMLRQRLETQIITGNGTAPNLRGLFNISGIQTQAKGADPTPDAFYKAMTKLMVTAFAEPNAIIMHPNDWQDIRLLRTVDGVYIWGNPSEAGPERLWGLPVRKSIAVTEGTGGVIDTNYFLLFYKAGISFQVSDSHDDYFIKGKQAIRAQMRAGFLGFRPSAFCTVTGI